MLHYIAVVGCAIHHPPRDVRTEQARAHEIHQVGVAEATVILATGEAEAKECTTAFLCALL